MPKPCHSSALTGHAAHPVEEKVSQLEKMTISDLRATWSQAHGRPPPKAFSRQFLVLSLAWKLQETAFGGHSRSVLKLLDAYATGKPVSLALHKRIKAGTVLIREHNGERHTVTVSPDGYIWRERTFASLSIIAQTITGTKWNGPRFFGLRDNTSLLSPSSSNRGN